MKGSSVIKNKKAILVKGDLINSYDQKITLGEKVLFIGTSAKVTKHHAGIFAGYYCKDDKIVSARINDVTRAWGRRYSILPLHRVFKLPE